MTRRQLLVAVGCAAAAGATYRVFFWRSDEDEIREQIAALCAAASFSPGTNPAIYATNVRAAFKQTFAPSAVIDAPELGGAGLETEALAGVATQAAGRYASVAVVASDVKVQVQAKQATASATVIVTAIDHGAAPRVEQRQVRFDFSEIDGEWRVARLVVVPPV